MEKLRRYALASGGRNGISKLHVCENCTMNTPGIFINNSDIVFGLFTYGVSMEM